jgi:hypothetical protein
MGLKKALTTSSILVATLWMGLVGGCGTGLPEEGNSDPSLQGDNLNAGGGSTTADEGDSTAGDDDGRVTVCHIPPGNPANAHTIRVGQPAVKAHLKHGDTLGACEGTSEPDGGTTDPGGGTGSDGGTTGPGSDAGTPDPQTDAGTPVCVVEGSACGAGTVCCTGLQCSDGVCSLILN